MENLLNAYYLKQPEPMQTCLFALKSIILKVNPNITHQRKFQIPFFYYKDKKISYLWVTKKQLRLGFVEDKNIYPKKEGVKLQNKYYSIIIDPNKDIPIKMIVRILKKTIKLYDKVIPNN